MYYDLNLGFLLIPIMDLKEYSVLLALSKLRIVKPIYSVQLVLFRVMFYRGSKAKINKDYRYFGEERACFPVPLIRLVSQSN